MLNAEALEHMRETSTLINFSRGGVVDETAVKAAR